MNISANTPLDESGMFGRECLKCVQYFKLIPDTGLETDYCNCPYYEGKADTFWTQAQISMLNIYI